MGNLMGASAEKEQASLRERIRVATEDLNGEPSAEQVANALDMLAEMKTEVKRLGLIDNEDFQDRLGWYQVRIENCQQGLKERGQERRALEQEKRTDQRKLETARRARTAFSEAVSRWRDELDETKDYIQRLERRRPLTGAAALIDPEATAEGIAERLVVQRKKLETLESHLKSVEGWGDSEILKWYMEGLEEKRHASEQREQQEKLTAQKRGDPGLEGALSGMKEKLKFAVENCVDILLAAELSDTLCDPIPDSGEEAALEFFAPPTAVVSRAEDVVDELDQAGFPDGDIKEVAKRLIRAHGEAGAGFGARLRPPEVGAG
jgi:hypothetical protein